MTLSEKQRRIGAAGVVLALTALAFVALDRLTHEVRYEDVRTALHALTPLRLAGALAFTAASYLALTFYDFIALRVIGRPLPWRTAALASFTSYTLSHNLGLGLLTGGSARYRIYVAAGLDGPDVARVIALAGATFWAGVVTVAALAMAAGSVPIDLGWTALAPATVQVVGCALLACVVLLSVVVALQRKPLSLMGATIRLPGAPALCAQFATGLADLACASAALFVLIPGADPATFPLFLLAWALGIVVALISHVPGGLGVFEATVMAVLPAQDRTGVFAALIVYRLIYYVAPLALGVVLLAWHEVTRSPRLRRVFGGMRSVVADLLPVLLGGATFLAGAMLLLSGALPPVGWRIDVLGDALPLLLIEASHVAASMAGTALMLIAPGLYRRLDGASVVARVLLLAGALFSLGKGIDYEEATVCLMLAALLQLGRRKFDRKTALTAQPLGAGWIVAIAMAATLAGWAGLFAFRHVPYSDALWWRFALQAEAPRYMRAMLGCVVLLLGFAARTMLAPAPAPTPAMPKAEEWATIRRILATADRTEAMLALTGDKRFLISRAGDAFLMYQVEGATWVVMGDPVGARESWEELLWQIRDLSHRQQGRLLIYEASSAALDIAIAMGLQIVKYGEEAVLDLAAWSLDTPEMRSVRKSERVAARAGASFRIIPAAAVPVIMDEIEAVSDEWLATRNGREKGFSLGFFDRAYMSCFDLAVVMFEGRIVAFANLWLTEGRQEASVDLMRHSAAAPRGTMDFLFANLLLWAKAQGYRHFTLGMVPLSGIEGRRLAPAWARAAALVFRHGERFYGFRGLRAYKDKFGPVWRPRYLAGPQDVGLLQALRDVSRLIGRQPVPTRTAPPSAPSTTASAVPALECAA
ncbi:bifunctional lysylphosphatidylglycerol flippase/synthetase MprF [Novosphingobium jiangmenense]|uniref:Bifunctional lysylphosphatidylglycerol flippase/synthetase MprF n=1 Tax=Novosphingobium jiangmenense TaxID=2791981 RepID=A0ABS0HHT9_9SPHN|nr:bifunctional lysylphosphatidylglycerol flippase/synthetase MprF [Novosphingobium jiangmenense]MBF9151816.1 bifunctional lysylphosphatidylglycerol flippase/synthetase MprF [Novosphingobium jiangmenense]